MIASRLSPGLLSYLIFSANSAENECCQSYSPRKGKLALPCSVQALTQPIPVTPVTPVPGRVWLLLKHLHWKTSSLLIFSFPWAQTASPFFEHHLMLREEGNPRNKRTARCDESRTGRHAPATWTDEIPGTGFSLAISSNSNTTFVLQNGITNTNTRRKYSVS